MQMADIEPRLPTTKAESASKPTPGILKRSKENWSTTY